MQEVFILKLGKKGLVKHKRMGVEDRFLILEYKIKIRTRLYSLLKGTRLTGETSVSAWPTYSVNTPNLIKDTKLALLCGRQK